ncbi:SAM-dependent methyltransferase [Pseudonocardia sp. CA-107938]|uniref:SAM-dependent methyltransferase n=1 Tax=Pseudonocardia sp. CA-107938 TaxID=3240021 RepID=UPI003D8C83BF
MPEPGEIDHSRPNSARIWNHWLGGKDNYQVDREVADAVAARMPEIRDVAREGRRFLVRAVTFLAGEAGIDQFLDIGTGLPTMENTHEVAQRTNPRARIVYVDKDPLVLVHAKALLTNVSPAGRTWYVQADVRKPEQVLDEARALLDLDRPVAVLLLGVLGLATPEFSDMLAVVRTLMAAMASGSYLALLDGTDTSEAARSGANLTGYRLRSPDELRECADGLELLEPGLVPSPHWRPEPHHEPLPHLDSYVLVARKP